jgi:hypothetical protein
MKIVEYDYRSFDWDVAVLAAAKLPKGKGLFVSMDETNSNSTLSMR